MAVEQVIRALQERVREGGSTGALSRRRELLRPLSQKVRRRLVETVDLDPHAPGAQEKAHALIRRYLEDEEGQHRLLILTSAERLVIEQRILSSVFGYGILTPFLLDETTTEIMVNGVDEVFVERKGQLVRVIDGEGVPLAFEDRSEMLAVIEKIVAPLNRKVDESDPIVDARLPDGSRVSIVLPPVALDGPTITIRKFPQEPFALHDLAGRGALPQSVVYLLQTLVAARCNIVVSGATSSGKTTFLNALGMVIPAQQRVVTVEDAAELKLPQVENLVRLEARPPNIEGRGHISIRDLVRTSLRMRPDRIIVGEVRGGEAVDMLQAMNTGHDGSLTTAHANSAQDLLSRLETMVLMSGMELPVSAIRQQIASAVDVVIHLARTQSGRRQVVQVAEVAGVDQGEVRLEELYAWQTAEGAGDGGLVWTGRQLVRTGKFLRNGVAVPRLGEV